LLGRLSAQAEPSLAFDAVLLQPVIPNPGESWASGPGGSPNVVGIDISGVSLLRNTIGQEG
jgi:hypothetical protein